VSIDLTSARCLAAYVYAGGAGESTTDLAWDGQTSIFKNGTLLAEGERFRQDGQITVTDVDLYLLRQGRGHEHVSRQPLKSKETSSFPPYSILPDENIGFVRTVERYPFVPSDESGLEQDCYEAYNIQVAGRGCARSNRSG
jgi:NAD+ synthase (glutamine-hydrolysing)